MEKEKVQIARNYRVTLIHDLAEYDYIDKEDAPSRDKEMYHHFNSHTHPYHHGCRNWVKGAQVPTFQSFGQSIHVLVT